MLTGVASFQDQSPLGLKKIQRLLNWLLTNYDQRAPWNEVFFILFEQADETSLGQMLLLSRNDYDENRTESEWEQKKLKEEKLVEMSG